MKTGTKKLISLLISLAVILTALPLAGVTAFAATSGDYKYTVLKDGTAEIRDYTGNAETLEIPSKLDTYTVTSIGGGAFLGCNSLTSVTIPESVISMGGEVFGSCYSLTEIKVDANNKNYSSQEGVLFDKNKTELIQYPIGNTRTSYDIPNGVTSIGYWAFLGCNSLTSITIPEGVTSIGEGAFADCDGLTSVTIGNGVTSIGAGAFDNCDSLTSVTIGNGVTSIGEYAFAYCDSLTEINVDVSNKNYSSQDGVLFNKNKTELIDCPEGKTGAYKIPDGVTSIGDNAFYGCDGITSVTIPESVTSIGDNAFGDCKSLTEIKVDANNKNYSSQDGVLFDKNKTELIQYPTGNTRTSYKIPNTVTSIGDGAFVYCDSLTSITIPNSVTSIGDNAFYGCDGITSVTIGNGVTIIGEFAFFYCDSLTDIYILNKDCYIASSYIPTETTIHGYAGSTAESYAKENGNKFVAICDHLNIEKVPAKAATCTEDGNIEYYHCSECNKNFKDINGNEEVTDVVVKATGHNMEQVPAKAATCTEDGNIEYYHCSTCNKNFKDKDGNEEVTDVVVKAMGHKYEDGVCTVCGAEEPVNPSDPTNPDTPKPTGEVSGDGKLSTVDAKWILQYIAGSKDFSDAQFKTADLNGDGKVTTVDAKWVLQAVAGMRTV